MALAAMDIRIRGHDNQVCHPRPDRGVYSAPRICGLLWRLMPLIYPCLPKWFDLLLNFGAK